MPSHLRVRPSTRASAALLAGLVLLGAVGVAPAAASAPIGKTFTVNSTADAPDADPANGTCATSGGKCTLRAAIMQANHTAATDTIKLPKGVFKLTRIGGDDTALRGDLDITASLTIAGAGAGTTIVDGNGPVTGDRVFHVLQTANVVIFTGLTVRNGGPVTVGASKGGGIFAYGPSPTALYVTVRKSVIEGSHALTGAGIQAESATLIIDASTIRNNATGAAGIGGGVFVKDDAALTVRDSRLSGNTAGFGGALAIEGVSDADVLRSTLDGNTAENGGGVYIESSASWPTSYLTVTDSTIRDNTASQDGGGIYTRSKIAVVRTTLRTNHATQGGGGGIAVRPNPTSSLDIRDSTISGNTAVFGGGIEAQGAPGAAAAHQIVNSTISNNRVNGDGGGVSAYSGVQLSFYNSTIAGNVMYRKIGQGGLLRGGGIFTAASTVHLRNTIVADNIYTNGLTTTTADDCFTYDQSVDSLGWNLIESTANCLISGTTYGNITGTDPKLAPLEGDGGRTETRALLPHSPAIDAGEQPACRDGYGATLAADQRGVQRPQGAGCDIGASELASEVGRASAGGDDGWVLESGETTNSGGTLDRTATTIRVGDNARRRQYRSLLHFDTTLPAGAVVIRATLLLKKQGQAGTAIDLFSKLKGLLVDTRRPSFGTTGLTLGDFRAAGSPSVAKVSATGAAGWHSAAIGPGYINATGTTQFRLRFALGDNNDGTANYLRFWSGNAATLDRPQLLIKYYVPLHP